MSGFSHDIAGGNGQLVVSSVKSPNFVHGVSGWSISKDGSAEFNGTMITGAQFVADGTTGSILAYSGTPAAGNLVASFSVSGGSDSYGNTILEDWTVYLPNTVGGTSYAISMTAAGSGSQPSLRFYEAVSYSGTWNESSSIVYDTLGTPGLLTITGRGINLDGSGNRVMVRSGALVAEDPSNPGFPETWHDAALQNGWTNHVSTFPCQYQYKSDNEVEIMGRVNGSAATSSTIFTLPPGYVPNNGFLVCEGHDFNDTANSYGIYVQSSGAVQAVGPSTTPSDLNFHGYIPLVTNTS